MVRHARMMWLLVAIAIPLLLSAGGCDNKIKKENDALRKQNSDQQAQIDAAKADADAKNAEIERLRAAAIAAQAPTATMPAASPDMGPAVPDAGGSTDMGSGVSRSKSRSGETQLEVASDILFDSGKSTLKPSAKRSLERLVAILKSEYAGKSFRIEGHTDNVPFKKGSKMDNQKLGLARANAVEKFLISKGISASHLTTVSMGASQPKSKTNLALNRRVDVVVEH